MQVQLGPVSIPVFPLPAVNVPIIQPRKLEETVEERRLCFWQLLSKESEQIKSFTYQI